MRALLLSGMEAGLEIQMTPIGTGASEAAEYLANADDWISRMRSGNGEQDRRLDGVDDNGDQGDGQTGK